MKKNENKNKECKEFLIEELNKLAQVFEFKIIDKFRFIIDSVSLITLGHIHYVIDKNEVDFLITQSNEIATGGEYTRFTLEEKTESEPISEGFDALGYANN